MLDKHLQKRLVAQAASLFLLWMWIRAWFLRWHLGAGLLT